MLVRVDPGPVVTLLCHQRRCSCFIPVRLRRDPFASTPPASPSPGRSHRFLSFPSPLLRPCILCFEQEDERAAPALTRTLPRLTVLPISLSPDARLSSPSRPAPPCPRGPSPSTGLRPMLWFLSGVVRIRSTTSVCLLHGLVLLPCGISVAGADDTSAGGATTLKWELDEDLSRCFLSFLDDQ
ncbi:hypothetical protein VPH35_044569 [Triticum aestivum]